MDDSIKAKSVKEVDYLQQRYFGKVFMWLAIALGFTGIVALFTANSNVLLYFILSNKIVFYGLFIFEFFLVIKISRGLSKMSSTMMTMSLILYSVINGVLLSTIFLVYTAGSIASVFFLASAMFLTMFMLGYFIKIDMTKFSSFFMFAIIGLVISMVANIFLKSSAMEFGISIIGVLVFAGLTMYDAQKLKNISLMSMDSDEQLQKYVIWGVLQIYLDLINMFLFLLRIFGRRK